LAWGEKDGTVTNSERRISRQRGFLPAPEKAKPDWWQMAQVAKAMGFSSGFNFKYPSEIFAEFARLSGHKNHGVRDFDISGHSAINIAEYNELKPHQWPYRPDHSEADTRFFADGDFYTPDRKARFIPISAQPVLRRDSGFLTLNTGRIRDHWHTMTRTGLSQRLSSHIGEPFCEIHPEDAFRLGVKPANLVRLWTDRGDILVRAWITDRQQLGSVFVPIHWSDQFASSARVDALFSSDKDPVSGQPALKNTPVQVAPFAVQKYGYLISRAKPEVVGLDYWALAQRQNGWQLEFAIGENSLSKLSFWECLGIREETAQVAYRDATSNAERYAWFEGSSLETALFLDPKPVGVSRSWAVEQLNASHDDMAQRWLLASGRAPADQPDKGAIVCSCHGVGTNQITAAVLDGFRTVETIGEATCAGTNCGSCRAEISGLIDEQALIAAE
ncbi:MAG: (2Fe-2S)-binding protein, partial [Flavobacteriales bacterium]|nr:(2Fe-2S)-binding protein [Flavobacteriales bacterium]